jgi:nitric oxide reductase large subunit
MKTHIELAVLWLLVSAMFYGLFFGPDVQGAGGLKPLLLVMGLVFLVHALWLMFRRAF